MSINRRTTSIGTLIATTALALTTAQCGNAGSPNQPTTTRTVSGVALSESSVAAGGTVQGIATLTTAAASGGTSISLVSSNAAVATVPSSVMVQAGSMTAPFVVRAMAAGAATISAVIDGSPQSAMLTVNGGPGLSSIVLREASVVGGNAVIGTVTLSSAAAGAAVVSLSGSDPASVPATVTVAADSMTATFTVSTRAVDGIIASTIRGTFGGRSASAVLSVTPVVSTTAFANFGVNGTDVTGTCGLTNNGASLDCNFDGSTSKAPGRIIAWEWSYTVATTQSVTTSGPVLTMPAANCGLLPPPPLPAGTTSFPLTVRLRIRDSLGNVSAEAIDRGARVLPQGACGF